MMSKSTLAMLAGLVALAMCMVTEAFRGEQGQGRRDGGDFIGRLDANGDGVVSEEEFDGPLEHFDQMDRNADGYIDEAEAPQGPPPGRGPGEFVQRLDRDGDGRVALNEFDGPEEHFGHLDLNGDGYIDESEAPHGPPPRPAQSEWPEQFGR